MEELVKAGGFLTIVIVALQSMLLLYLMAARRLSAARLDNEFLVLLQELSASVPERSSISFETGVPSWQGKRKFQITWREYETPSKDICSFYFMPCDGKPIPGFRPGQFLTFELNIPGQPGPLTRCYSLSDSPNQRQYYRVTIKRMDAPLKAPAGAPSGLSSCYFHDNLQLGDIVDVYAPSGDFCCDENSARPLVLIAGGAGLTPFLSMLNAMIVIASEREVWLFHGVTNQLDHVMREHLEAICFDLPNLHIVTFYSDPTPGCALGTDYDIAGLVRVECMKPLLPAGDYQFLVCGPPAMMAIVMADLCAWGVPEHAILTETFGRTLPCQANNHDASTHLDTKEEVAVTFLRSNTTVQWTANLGSLLELAEAYGIKTRSNCRAGNCGTCMTALPVGDVEYDQPLLRIPPQGFCLPCIARPRGDLVLDL